MIALHNHPSDTKIPLPQSIRHLPALSDPPPKVPPPEL